MFPTTPPAFINTALLTHSFLFSRGKCGAGADVQVLLGSLDGRRFTAEKAQKPIWFGEVAVGAKQQRVVRVSNPTPLPLPFCWQQTDHPISSGKLRTLLLMLACLIKQACHLLTLSPCLPACASLACRYRQSLMVSSGKPCTAHNLLLASKLRHRNSLQSN